jgi:hypothetical protein
VIFGGDKTALDSSPAPAYTLDALRTRFAINLAFSEAALLPLFDNCTAFCVVAASLSRFFFAFAASLTAVATSFSCFFTSLNLSRSTFALSCSCFRYSIAVAFSSFCLLF